MNRKYVVKIEDPLYEQSYKFREDELHNGLEDIRKIFNPDFLNKVAKLFKQMHELRVAEKKGIVEN